MTKQYSYQRHPVVMSVKIYTQDVTADLRALDDIQKSIDYPQLTEFRVGECSFTLKDIHGDFSPNNPANFFTRNGGKATGYQSPVQIAAGFIVNGTRHTQTVFTGQIIRLVQDAKAGTVKFVCTDNFGDMRNKPIADFGVPRHFKLTEDSQQTEGNGVYPILKAALPASHDSVTLQTRSGGTQIKPVQKLQTEGHLDPLHYSVTEEGIQTEGGFIVNRGVGYPQVQLKSPFRYREITDVIADILTHAGITQSEITIPEIDVASHFSSSGRVNYEGIGTIRAEPLTWNGYVTDVLQEGDKRYYLYTPGTYIKDPKYPGWRYLNPYGIPMIIVYDGATRTSNVLHTFSNQALEPWKFTKIGNDFYVVAAGAAWHPAFFDYDSNDTDARTSIIKLTGSGTPLTFTETEFVARTATLTPQLAHYYAGMPVRWMLPDTRRKLIYYNNALYYVYVNRGTKAFGIAKATLGSQTAVITINQDTYGNHAGVDFDINASGTLKMSTTFLSGTKSQTIVCKKNL